MSRITRPSKALLALVLLALAVPASAVAGPAFVRVGDFDQPIHVASPPNDRERLFVVQRPGTIRVVRNGSTLATPFLDITADVRSSDDERGLLSVAFAPDYESSGLFYVYMTANPDGQLQVREYRRSAASADRADPTGRVVWSADHNEAANHNGGQLDFGPDGRLWFATGDGGGSNNQFGHARDLASPLGKLLRIDPRPGNAGSYTIPADNPFGTAVWAYGLRNPFRFSFDSRGSKDLFIGDVGQGAREEIDWARFADGLGKGADYGWSCREGTVAGPTACATGANYLPPIFDYEQGSPRAVTGGLVVRDPGLPTLLGRYVYADAYTAVIRSFVPATPRATGDRDEGLPSRPTLVSFAEDACGHVYVVSIAGSVDRLQDGAVGACVLRPAPAAIPTPLPPGPPTLPTVPDRTSPRVRIALARKGRVGLRATPRIALTVSEACRVTVTARAAKVKFKRVRTALRGGHRTILRLRPTRKGAKKLRRALKRHRRATLIVSVTARDAAGNTGRVQRRMKIRRG